MRLHADHPDVAREPCGDPADQSAAAHRDDHGVERGLLLSELLCEGPLAGDDGRLVVRVQERRSGVERPLLARREGLRVEPIDHAPYERIRSTFIGGDVDGTKISAGCPRRWAA